MRAHTPSHRRRHWLGLIGLFGLLAFVAGCTETARPPGYPESNSAPPVPKISVGNFSGELAPGMPSSARDMLMDALREHLRERDLLWTDPANPRIDLTGGIQAYDGRYGNPPDDSIVVDLTAELHDGSKLLTSAAINRHVVRTADWATEMRALAESMIDELMRRVAPPPPAASSYGYGDAGYGYPPAYGGAYSAYPYYYPGAYYGYAVPPYGYYYGGPSYWWPYYYWGWGGRDHDHGHGGYPGGGNGGGGYLRPPPPVPSGVFNSVPRTHGAPGFPPTTSPAPAMSSPSGSLAPRPTAPGGMGAFEPPRSHRPSVPGSVFSMPQSPPPTAPSTFRAPSMTMPVPRSAPMESRPTFSAPAVSAPVMRAPSFSPPMSAPSMSRPAPPPVMHSAPPPAVFSAPSSGGGGGHRRR